MSFWSSTAFEMLNSNCFSEKDAPIEKHFSVGTSKVEIL